MRASQAIRAENCRRSGPQATAFWQKQGAGGGDQEAALACIRLISLRDQAPTWHAPDADIAGQGSAPHRGALPP